MDDNWNQTPSQTPDPNAGGAPAADPGQPAQGGWTPPAPVSDPNVGGSTPTPPADPGTPAADPGQPAQGGWTPPADPNQGGDQGTNQGGAL